MPETTRSEGNRPQSSARDVRRGWLALILAAVIVLLLAWLLSSIVERRREANLRDDLFPIDRLETDNSAWAVNWPRQYDSYRAPHESTTRTKYGGTFPRDYLESTPANVVLFAGYGFSKEYLQARSHTYAVDDVLATERVGENTPATCWTCKSPDVPRLMYQYGAETLEEESPPLQEAVLAGAGPFYEKNFHAIKDQIEHPVGCLDCHDPETMKLRISRPALLEALDRQGRDLSKVTHQEMRSLICAQCHVEYYFQKEGDYLTFPWDHGTRAEAIEAYYEESDFSDWTHAISGTRMVKIQHPDYEIYRTGIHAYRDVACTDCHMPYRTEGGFKFTDHGVASPLNNINNSCAVCHRWKEEEIRGRVESIQDTIAAGRDRAERVIATAHFAIAACDQAGADQEQLAGARANVRKAQLYWDMVAAHNGMGFHSPLECQRLLTIAVEAAQESRLESRRVLGRLSVETPPQVPDYSSKEKAQTLIGHFTEGDPPDLLKNQSPAESTAPPPQNP